MGGLRQSMQGLRISPAQAARAGVVRPKWASGVVVICVMPCADAGVGFEGCLLTICVAKRMT